MAKGRWAIQSTAIIDGRELTHWFKRQEVGFFNMFTGKPDEAMTWPRKADAEGYMRRVLGRRSDYSIVNLAAH